MSSRSTRVSRSAIAKMCPMLKFTLSTAVISHWTRRQIRLPHWCKDSPVLHEKGAWRGGRDEAALRGLQPAVYWVRSLKTRGSCVGQENSNHNRSIGGYRHGFGGRVSGRRLQRRRNLS